MSAKSALAKLRNSATSTTDPVVVPPTDPVVVPPTDPVVVPPQPQPQPDPAAAAIAQAFAFFEEGLRLVDAKGSDLTDFFVEKIPSAILPREYLPALDAKLEPFTEKEVEAKYRALVATIRGCAILGGETVKAAKDFAESVIEDGKVGEVKNRKGNAASMARGIVNSMVETGVGLEAAAIAAMAGADGAFVVAKAILKSMLKRAGKLHAALATGNWDQEKRDAFVAWVADGNEFL